MVEINRKKQRLVRVVAWLAWIAIMIAITLFLLLHEIIPMWAGAVLVLSAFVIGHTWMYRPGGVPALIYHSVSDHADWLPWKSEITVQTKTFALHLATLKKMGCHAITSEQFVRLRKRGETVPPNAVMIHLDDGYLDNWVAAYPLLKRAGMSATLFISTDFVEPGKALRPTLDDDVDCRELEWRGYVNWQELAELDRSNVINIQAHGTDHARGEVNTDVVETINQSNWRKLIWKQWQGETAGKYDWYKWTLPPHFPFGTRLGKHIPVLSDPVLNVSGVLESQSEYEIRVRDTFQQTRSVIRRFLDKEVTLFCWPHNVFSVRAHQLALESGFEATLSGTGENREDEDYQRISRVHIHENVLGWYWQWSEALALRANVRLFQGNFYWYPLIFLFNTCRKTLKKLARPNHYE